MKYIILEEDEIDNMIDIAFRGNEVFLRMTLQVLDDMCMCNYPEIRDEALEYVKMIDYKWKARMSYL